MKRVVITGATSFIGISLIEEWLKEACEIYAVVRPNSSNLSRIPMDKKINIVEREMAEYDRLSDDILYADFFYHLAWMGTRAPYRDDKITQEKNFFCTLKAFESAVEMGCSFFLGAGSQAEYGTTNGLVNEEHPCHPDSEYGKEKLRAYRNLSVKTGEMDIRFIWIRIFSVYGRYDYPGTLVMTAIDKMKKNMPMEMTLCTQLWDYLNVVDAARAMKLFALRECENGVYNLASGEYKPLKDFVEEIKKVINSKSELLFGAIEYGLSVPVNLVPDVKKIKEALQWQPEIGFSEGIKNMIESMEV